MEIMNVNGKDSSRDHYSLHNNEACKHISYGATTPSASLLFAEKHSIQFASKLP